MNTERALIHKGSTKDVYKLNDELIFQFSDRYSVFDWGEMPDQIPAKGESLAKFTKKIYAQLEKQNIRTHLKQDVVANDELAVTPYKVLRGDYTSMPREENLFIPLEVIFRLGVAKGSSLLKRSNAYYEGMKFAGPVIEFTTKLERFDRPLAHDEAKLLAGFNDEEWDDLLATTSKIAMFLHETFMRVGIDLWDGKVEFAFGKDLNGKREIILVDSIGPDELRLSKDGVQLSKEIIRQFYRRTPWYETMEAGKLSHGENFKSHVPSPEKLPESFLSGVSTLYKVLADVILNEDAKSQNEALGALNDITSFLKDFQ